MLWVPGSLGILAGAGLYPLAGFHAFWFLTACVPGFIMHSMFGAIGKKLQRLKQNLPAENADGHEALIAIDNIQSPGLAVVDSRQLQLIPLTGQPVTLSLEEIQGVKQSARLPGKYLVGKIAFHLTVEGYSRLAFAVAASVGNRWATHFDLHTAGTLPGGRPAMDETK